MKSFGQLLMWVGFLSGALATVFNLPSDGVEFAKSLEPSAELRFELTDLSAVEVPADGWGLVPWVWYGFSAAACFVGVVLIRFAKSSNSDSTAAIESTDLNPLNTSLSRLIKNSEALGNLLEKLPPSKIVSFIDDQLADDFRIFADHRERLVSRFNLTLFADVMTDFAAGERAINRAWSAAADGYIDEVNACVTRATTMLRNAAEKLGQAQSNGR